jgi:acetyltransferase-like isoleucine patch superfamily enzyme
MKHIISLVIGEIVSMLWKAKLLCEGVKVGQGVSITGFGKIKHGKGVTIGDYSAIVVDKGATLRLFDGCGIGRLNRITCLKDLAIGKDTITAQCCSIMDNKHITRLCEIPYKAQGYEKKETSIGSNVWIGANCVILYDIKIGDNAIIGANSLVRTNVPKNTMYAGSPAVFKKDLRGKI